MSGAEHELYKKIILDHSRNPYHFLELKDLKDVDIVKADNLDCGDSYCIYIRTKDNKIEDIFFYGEGCALSKAASSILCKNIDKNSIDIAQKIIISFLNSMDNKDFKDGSNYEKNDINPEDFRVFESVKSSSRIGCVVFVFEALRKYLGSLN